INPALLPALWVAGWPWNGWPDHRGISGRMFMEWVAGCPWNPQEGYKAMTFFDLATNSLQDTSAIGLLMLIGKGWAAFMRPSSLLTKASASA
ncbi:hypothetical protein, partial [Pseudomonas carnis]|uniref:hypothetical protein n=1 Tax=Pseudomonas carnis TaxID=2487355 RepID=UPI001F1BA1B8